MNLLDVLVSLNALSEGTIVVAVLTVAAAVSSTVVAYVALRSTSRAGRR